MARSSSSIVLCATVGVSRSSIGLVLVVEAGLDVAAMKASDANAPVVDLDAQATDFLFASVR